MLKKYFIITFLFLFIQIFFQQEKIFAFNTITNGCVSTTTTETRYILTNGERDGQIDLCFNDTALNTNDIFLGTDIYGDKLVIATTTTGSNQHYFYSTTSVPLGTSIFKFFIQDQGGEHSDARFDLTLRPAFRVKFLNQDYADYLFWLVGKIFSMKF